MEEEALMALGLLLVLGKKERLKLKRKWAKGWLLKRSQFSHTNLLEELRLEPDDWFNYLRMDKGTYSQLLQAVTPHIKRQDTVLREAITPHERLSATLRFLCTGRNYEDLKFSTIISAQSLGKIIPETCLAIYKALSGEYMKFPNSKEEWTKIAEEYEKRWQFPNCLGAVDGKHLISS